MTRPRASVGEGARAAAARGRPVAIVTGGRRGIGRACAVALARAGFDLAITDREAEADEALAAVAEAGARGAFFASDLADVAGHAATVAAVCKDFGRIDVLVNNAGVGAATRGDFLDLAPEHLQRALAINLSGTVFFTQTVVRAMLAAPGAKRAIVTITSVSAAFASPDRLDYCMSKAALAAFCAGLAVRLAPEGIAVFEVRPGIIRTDMTAAVAQKYDGLIADGLVPARRWGEPEDVGAIVAALASGAFSFATGSVIGADGALSVPHF